MLSQEAYILFYARQGTPWISSIMENLKPSLVQNTSPKSVLDNVENLYSSKPCTGNFVLCDANVSKEITEKMSDYSCGGKNEVPAIVDASRDPEQFHFELNQATISFNGSRDDTTLAQVPCNERNGTLSSHDENNGHQEVVDTRENDGFHPLTPPSSPSQDDFPPGNLI